MKILIANKFYYPRGGDCIYAIGLEKLLKDAGHEVAFFAMDYPENLDSPWKQYWPSEVSFSPKKPLQFLHAFARPFGDKETKQKFTDLLDVFKPDVVHLNNIHTQLSPVIAEIAHARGIKVVWTLHDYKLLCPAYTCYNCGIICEKCIGGDKRHCFDNRCLKGSIVASYIAKKEAELWTKARLEKCVDLFICPSHFMKEKMEVGGFSAHKLVVLSNFVNMEKLQGDLSVKENYYCYVGRLSEEKGIRTLLKVSSILPYELKVLGTGPLEDELRAQYARCKNIEFLGHCDWTTCKKVIASSKFSVLPSEWYENNPLSVIESICLGTPVLGANIGGIPELIESGKTGTLFVNGSFDELEKNIQEMFKKKYCFDRFSFAKMFASEHYLQQLQNLFLQG